MNIFSPLNNKERIVEFLIAHQDEIKDKTQELRILYEAYLETQNPVFRFDLKEQYEARIKQLIAFVVADNTNIPIIDVIILLEKIEIEEFLNV